MKTPAHLKSPLAIARRLLDGCPQAALDDASFLPWLIVEGASALAPRLERQPFTTVMSDIVKAATPRIIYRDAAGNPTSYSLGPGPAVGAATPHVVLANPTLAPKPSEGPTVFSPPLNLTPPVTHEPPENKSVVQPISGQQPADGLNAAPPEVGAEATDMLASEPSGGRWSNLDFEPIPDFLVEKAKPHWAERDRPPEPEVPPFVQRAMPGIAAAEKMVAALTASQLGSEANPMLAQTLPGMPPEGEAPVPSPQSPVSQESSADDVWEGDDSENEFVVAAPPASSLASSSPPPSAPPLPSRAPPSPPIKAPLAVTCGLVKDWPKREAGEDNDRYQKRLTYVIQMSEHQVTINGPNGPEQRTLQQPMVTGTASRFANVLASRLKLTSPWVTPPVMNAKPALSVNVNTLLPDISFDMSGTFRPLAEKRIQPVDREMAKFGFVRYGFEFSNSPVKGGLTVIEAFVLVNGDDVDTKMVAGMLRLQDFGYDEADLYIMTPTIFGYGMIVTEVNDAWLKETTAGLATIGIHVRLTGASLEAVVTDTDDSEY